MIISKNNKITFDDFATLVSNATDILNAKAKIHKNYFFTRNAQKLEDDVFDALNYAAADGVFRGTIQKISGQHFPDIVAARLYGVEVKSSKDSNWTTLGGSINESTRVTDVEHIFLTFGKLIDPVEFISRPYQDCLSDVVVTHYPRYKIDMKLLSGKTIFDKIGIEYDVLRKQANPTKEVLQYYKKLLKPGERLWWLDYEGDTSNDNIASASAKVRLWKTLSQAEKHKFIISAYALFPEIMGTATDKYDNFSLWLVSNYGIVSTSMRDSFSAGGRVNVDVNGRCINLSRSVYNLFVYKDLLKQYLDSVPEFILKELWKVQSIWVDRYAQWLGIVIKYNQECECLV